MESAVSTHLRHLAGVHAVAAELALRGWKVSLLGADRPDLDLTCERPRHGKPLALGIRAGRGWWRIGDAVPGPEGWRVEGIVAVAHAYVLVDIADDDGEPARSVTGFRFYIVPTPSLVHIASHHVGEKYQKRTPRDCWVNRIEASHAGEWREIAPFGDRWDLLETLP